MKLFANDEHLAILLAIDAECTALPWLVLVELLFGRVDIKVLLVTNARLIQTSSMDAGTKFPGVNSYLFGNYARN
jgi:hypothetical protein